MDSNSLFQLFDSCSTVEIVRRSDVKMDSNSLFQLFDNDRHRKPMSDEDEEMDRRVKKLEMKSMALPRQQLRPSKEMGVKRLVDRDSSYASLFQLFVVMIVMRSQ
jgi:hypothetical protein